MIEITLTGGPLDGKTMNITKYVYDYGIVRVPEEKQMKWSPVVTPVLEESPKVYTYYLKPDGSWRQM